MQKKKPQVVTGQLLSTAHGKMVDVEKQACKHHYFGDILLHVMMVQIERCFEWIRFCFGTLANSYLLYHGDQN